MTVNLTHEDTVVEGISLINMWPFFEATVLLRGETTLTSRSEQRALFLLDLTISVSPQEISLTGS